MNISAAFVASEEKQVQLRMRVVARLFHSSSIPVASGALEDACELVNAIAAAREISSTYCSMENCYHSCMLPVMVMVAVRRSMSLWCYLIGVRISRTHASPNSFH